MEQTISSDFIRGHIDTIILRSLFSGSKHAFEIAAFIEEKSGNKYEVKQATLYSALKRLEKQKYVKPFWNDAPSGGRRRYFEITPAGKAFADKNLSEWDYSRDVIDQLVDEVPKNLVHEAGVVLPGKSDAKKREEKIDTPPPEQIKQTEEVPKQTEQKQTFVYIREEPKKTIIQNEEHRKNEEICDPALEKILNSPQNEINYREILNNLYERNVKKHTDESPATVAEAEPERTVSKYRIRSKPSAPNTPQLSEKKAFSIKISGLNREIQAKRILPICLKKPTPKVLKSEFPREKTKK